MRFIDTSLAYKHSQRPPFTKRCCNDENRPQPLASINPTAQMKQISQHMFKRRIQNDQLVYCGALEVNDDDQEKIQTCNVVKMRNGRSDKKRLPNIPFKLKMEQIDLCKGLACQQQSSSRRQQAASMYQNFFKVKINGGNAAKKTKIASGLPYWEMIQNSKQRSQSRRFIQRQPSHQGMVDKLRKILPDSASQQSLRRPLIDLYQREVNVQSQRDSHQSLQQPTNHQKVNERRFVEFNFSDSESESGSDRSGRNFPIVTNNASQVPTPRRDISKIDPVKPRLIKIRARPRVKSPESSDNQTIEQSEDQEYASTYQTSMRIYQQRNQGWK